LVERVSNNKKKGFPPLMRVHVGPYNPNYEEAKKEFKIWLKTLANSRFLDIVSIGSSQLSQSDFGSDWDSKPNGGGVPINSENDLREIWQASRPMLVRTYAGTRNIPYLADVYERTINIAWHALSFWWFNKIDGRGPYTVKKNIYQHIDTLKYIAQTGKPFEPNIPHHFAFRGGDDYTYVLSSLLAAITAKKLGVRFLVLQIMFNTPKYTWGVQDLAKARALLKLVRELEDNTFKVFLQPRAGLDYFSPDMERAKVQLAAVSAMMDDIEPENEFSPDIIHVVSYCEAIKLATPQYINESIQITTKSIEEYRKIKKLGLVDDMIHNKEVQERTLDIYSEVKYVVKLIEQNINEPYTPEGLYQIFQKGILTAPYLWECREEFKNAIKWKTGLVKGGVQVIDEYGKPIKPSVRVKKIFNNL
ncbi:cobalamin-binding protein, partial [bacterium]|nr:cobalamin-binding protein [bacterium]